MEEHLTEEDLLSLEEMFKAADVDNSGTLSKRELKEIIVKSLD